MSEDFDREAEKKRLREKLEDDQESRQSTEHMSDLLLKGATMTNAHCDACGDPIFRYDGQEFCPTCGESVEDGDPSPEETTTGDESATDAGVGSTAPDGTGDEDGTTESRPSPTHSKEGTGARESSTGAAASRPDPSGATTGQTRGVSAPGRDPTTGDLGEARASLVRTLSNLAARAEATEDPRRARELLSATREAAETIAALDRADR